MNSGEPAMSDDRLFSYKNLIRNLLLREGSILYSFSISGDPAGCN